MIYAKTVKKVCRKKNTATLEKEWVSAFSIFSMEKKYDTTYLPCPNEWVSECLKKFL